MLNMALSAVLLLAAAPAASAAVPRGIILVPSGQGVEVRGGPAEEWRPVAEKVRLEQGAEIRTGAGGKAGVLLSDGSSFVLDNNSVFTVDDTGKKKTGFSLKLGRLKAAVAGYFASKFAVRTPTAVCAVRGTEFEVEVNKDGNTGMSVSEGLVEVNDNKGALAVVSSEEKISVGPDGLTPPENMSLKDERAGGAARPLAVRVETARERTRTMLEELRNRELKANEAQLGKDAIDAFGRRVRLEEYLLRPTDSELKLLFLSKRTDEARLDWGHLIERFNSKIPDDIEGVGKVIDGMYLSKTAPANWMKYFEVYLTNTVDSIKETIDFGAPAKIDFRGYTGSGSADYRYYPASIDYRQILSGPGVAALASAGSLVNTGLSSLAADERVQFRQLQDWNSTTANQFTYTQWVVNGAGNLGVLEKIALDPTDLSVTPITDNGYVYYDPAVPADVAIVSAMPNYSATINPTTLVQNPSGPGKADFFAKSTYEDGSTVLSRKLLVSNEGEILSIGGSADSGTFLKEGSYNLEMVMGSSLFQGRDIDVLFAPEILTQKKTATTTADKLAVN